MKTRDGARVYGAWAGNPAGHKEDVTLCIAAVWSKDRWSRETQCSRKRGHGPDGLYCKTHDPAAVKTREDRATAARDAKWEATVKKLYLGCDGPRLLDAIVQIAAGHNDARGLALQTLAALGRDPVSGERRT